MNPRTLELEAAKEIQAELFDIKTREVNDKTEDGGKDALRSGIQLMNNHDL
ncbi:MAG: hypothetical protein LUQ38_05275 [Methanotrichaceae archaeon]|nr:hypothetical protein [Methanotrichaceae archaeon]